MDRRLLIVEDDPAIAANLYTWFERAGFGVELAHTGPMGWRMLQRERFDIVLLDLGLPGLDGLTLLQRLRNELNNSVPVLVLSARGDLTDKLAGFEHGADDYVTKPFALAEVEARVVALLGRAAHSASTRRVQTLGKLSFDAAELRAEVGSTPVKLTPMATRLLALFMRTPGQLVRREQILDCLWPEGTSNSEALRSQVHWLRRALMEAGFDGLETIHGVGWRLVAPS